MLGTETRKSELTAALSIMELIFHGAVRSVRRGHSNAIVGLLTNIMQTLIFLGVFYIMYSVLGMRGNAIRGDFMVYLMSGIFLFMTNTKTMSAIVGAEGPTSAMMLHAPMNTTIAIGSAALASLYTQALSIIVIVGVYKLGWGEIHIEDPMSLLGMFLLAWVSGLSVGLVVLAMRPWWPGFVSIASMLYSRANMVASGKMFVANMLTPKMLALFSWNPLFHIIDQARGFAFINYSPHYSSVTYPAIVTGVLLTIGLMGEFFTRKHASASWSAGK
jgi:ABC-type polysaccharide/polyol phosphate export permease